MTSIDMSLNYKVLLDNLPVEVLSKILEYAKLENIIQCIMDEDFLNLNPNLKAAITGLISNSNISFNNRFIQYSFIHMYLRTKTYLDKHDLQFIDLETVEPLMRYCIQENITIVLTLSYYVWSLADIVNMVELIDKLPNYLVRYNLEIELVPGYLYNFNLNYLFNIIGDKIGESIDTIMVYNYSGSFKFNNSDFPNLKTLWFEDSNIKFVNAFPESLKQLHLYPNKYGWNNNHQVYVNQNLPENLDKLILGDCTVGAVLCGEKITSLELRTIKMRDSDDDYSLVKEFIGKSLVSGSLKELSIDSIWNSRNLIVDVKEELLNGPDMLVRLKQMFKLSITGVCPLLDHCTNLKSLSILKLNDPTVLDTYKFPNNLEELSLAFNNIKNLLPVDKNISLTGKLRVLNLADNPVDWALYIPNFKRFKNLKSLKLSNTSIGDHFPRITYPDSVEELSLEVNQIKSLQGVQFPKNLKNLGIGLNMIKIVDKPSLPKKLEIIHFTENSIESVDLSYNSQGEELLVEILYVNFTRLSKFDYIKYPNHLKILNFDNCKISNVSGVRFPATLMELSISGCGLKRFENVSWGSCNPKLKYLNLSQNNLTVFENKLPSCLESLNLSMNKLSNLSTLVLSNLESLRTVNLSTNKFTKFIYTFNIIHLQTLDLSFNSIKSLNLTFPKTLTTKLTVLNLCLNKLTNLTAQMIGHNKYLTMHKNMVEIDLTDNKIKSNEIMDKLSEFPSNLQCFFIGHTGEQDRFGYDLAKNVIKSGLCRGKRIDIP